MINIRLLSLLFAVSSAGLVVGQTPDSAQLAKEYNRLEDALKEPEKVYRLNLSNQSFASFPDSLSKFANLRYLSFRNDHLKSIPKEIGALKNLRVLDLSGNDFAVLPEEFAQLANLEELYLDDDPNLDLEQDFKILGKLPNLKYLHLDNDHLKSIPKDLSSCVVRATEARRQVILMRDAALDCLRLSSSSPSADSLTLANLLQTNAAAIEQDLTEGINSNDFHILMAKLDHAHRIFQETMHMTGTLDQCKDLYAAAVSGEDETMSALLKSDWNACVEHTRNALLHAQTIKQLAPDCHVTGQ